MQRQQQQRQPHTHASLRAPVAVSSDGPPMHHAIRPCSGSGSSSSSTRTPRAGRLWQCPAPAQRARWRGGGGCWRAGRPRRRAARRQAPGWAACSCLAGRGWVGGGEGVRGWVGELVLVFPTWGFGGARMHTRAAPPPPHSPTLLRAHAHTPAPSTPNSCPALNLRCSNTEVGLKSAACAPLRHGRVHGGGRIIRRADGWQARAPQAPLFCTHACTNSRALANQCDG